jgi:formylglycine-generating enzyme required for sulfatase activity
MKTLNVIATTLLLGISIISYSQTYPEMILVEGGTFTMGDTKMEGLPWEQPSHEVTLKTFKIAKTETTVAQWRAYCNATGRSMPETPSWGWIDNHPIVNVNYSDATAYCDWLAEKMDADYRLPTEAEWEYAARGGKLSKDTKYSGGRSIDNVGWYEDNSSSKTQVVATKNPNELGIYDMSGNVWEWCKDWSGDYSATAQTNPKGPTSGSYRVFRGGSWRNSATYCRVANRGHSSPAYRSNDYGFRVLLSQ